MDFLATFKRYFSRDKTQPMQSDNDPFLFHDAPAHPSVGLTVTDIYRIFSAAEQGDLRAQSELFADMEERDGHLFAEMSKRKRALLTLPFTVKPPPSATDAEKKIAAEAEWWIQQLPGFHSMMLDMMDAIGHGFSCVEIEWGRKGELWLPAKFHKRPQRMFTLPHDNPEEIRLSRGGTDGEPLWDLKWIVHKHKSKSGPLAQSGLFRVLAWTYLFKNLSARDWAQFLNLYGLPFRIGKYSSAMTQNERMALLRGIRMLAREGGGIIPGDAEIQLVSPDAGKSAPFLDMIEWCEKVQSKAILGGTLTSQADGKSSTNALGVIHNEVRHDLLVGDSWLMAETLTQQLLWPILAVNNRFDQGRAPNFEFDTRAFVDIERVMNAAILAQNAGFDITAEWLSDKSGIPLPQPGQTVLKPLQQMVSAKNIMRDTPRSGDAALSLSVLHKRAAMSAAVSTEEGAQRQLEAGLQLLSPKIAAASETMLAPLIEQIKHAQSPDEIYALLIDAYPTLNDTALRELVGQAVLAADVAGQHYA